MHTTYHLPSSASRAETDLPTNVQAVLPAVSYVNTHRPRFQVRVRPSYMPICLYAYLSIYVDEDVHPRETPPHTSTARAQPPAAHRRRYLYVHAYMHVRVNPNPYVPGPDEAGTSDETRPIRPKYLHGGYPNPNL